MKQILAWIIGLFSRKRTPPVIVVPPIEPPPPPIEPIKKINWPDRRPIGMIALAEWVEPYIADNRRWKLLGQYQFSKEALMMHAEESIRWMKYVGAQGMITWNIEGEQYWKPVSYIGDPTRPAIEIDPFLDEYFSRFKSSGFRVGVTLRPDSYDGGQIHYAVADPLADMIRKVDYTIDRWGCSLFYVDSNKDAPAGTDNTMGHGKEMPASIFAKLAKLYPSCLFIAEHYNSDYFPHVAIWGQYPVPVQGAVVAGQVRGDMEIEAFIKGGNIPIFEAWWKSDILDRLKAAYNA